MSDIRDIAIEIADLVDKKNKDYNNAFDETLDKYGDVAYFIRMEDKLSRLRNIIQNGAFINESVEDTLNDIVGYTLLLISHKKRKLDEVEKLWDNIKDDAESLE